MAREVDLSKYLPPFILNYAEINKIIEVSEPELNLVFNEIEYVLNSQFITTSDEVALKRFETLLNLNVDYNDSLETRIKRVLYYWSDQIPYTERVLRAKLDALSDNYILEIDYNNYILNLVVNVDIVTPTQIFDIRYILDTIVPANLVKNSEIVKTYLTKNNIYICNTQEKINIRSFELDLTLKDVNYETNADIYICNTKEKINIRNFDYDLTLESIEPNLEPSLLDYNINVSKCFGLARTQLIKRNINIDISLEKDLEDNLEDNLLDYDISTSKYFGLARTQLIKRDISIDTSLEAGLFNYNISTNIYFGLTRTQLIKRNISIDID